MVKSILQIYVKGKDEAFEFYKEAFGGAVGAMDIDDAGVVIHKELDIGGQAIAIGEARSGTQAQGEKRITGNTMQFCVQFPKEQEECVHKAYATLLEGSQVMTPFGQLIFSSCGFEIIDKYGVWWCIYC